MEVFTLFSEIHTQHRNTFSFRKLELWLLKLEVHIITTRIWAMWLKTLVKS